MIIDFRCRPPLPPFRDYFDLARVQWLAKRVGARSLAPSYLDGSMELFWREMDEAGIDIGVVLGRNSPEVFMGKRFPAAFIDNEFIAGLQADHPARLIGMAGIDVSGQRHDPVKETVRSVRELGLKGVFIEPGRCLSSHPADQRLFGVYEACVDLDVPVVIMTGPFAGPDIGCTHPLYVDQVATRYPALKIVLGHGCWPWIDETIGVAFKHSNVFISPDLYFFVPGAGRYLEAANGALEEQMLFATAFPLRPLGQTVKDTAKLAFTDGARRAYLADNGRRLLGLVSGT